MRQLKIGRSITNRDNGCLDKYLAEISRENMLAPSEEEVLATRIKAGDMKAMHKLIKGNLRFVVSVAKQYQNQGLSLPDLINEGNIGLIKAAQKFDSTKGFKFISYAVWWIRQNIMLALVDKVRMVRIPFNQVSQITKVKKAQAEFEQKNGREMHAYELSENLHMTMQAVKEVLHSPGYPVSLDSPISNEEGSASMYELFEDTSIPAADDELTKQSVKHDVRLTLKQLRPREREVVKMYYGIEYEDNFSVEQIAERLELTRERVRQVKDKALKKLKRAPKMQNLKMHLC
jgi:RNA polymerase primary sigma factor